MASFGAIELGGTKTLVAIGSSPDDLGEVTRIPTSDPETTMTAVRDALLGHDLDALGVAAFGPVELRRGRDDYGSILATPKPGWGGYELLGALADLGLPIGLGTDVGGAALGEGRWGSARGLSDYAYMTVGTGIGVGGVVAGSVLGGMSHPEMGHFTVRRMPGDTHPGSCPFHRGCLEGMASGPALETRFGPSEGWDHDVLGLVSHYVAQGLRNIVYALGPQRMIIGGGVSQLPGFHNAVQESLESELGGYPGLAEYSTPGYVVEPGLGALSGLAGGLVLAEMALDLDR